MINEEVDWWLGILSYWCKILMKWIDDRFWNDGKLKCKCDVNRINITRSVSNLGRGGNKGKVVSIIGDIGTKRLCINLKTRPLIK